MSRSLRVSQPKTRPFTLRLTDTERADLSRRAGSMPLAGYIRSVLFADGLKGNARGSRRVVKDQAVLAQILSALGSSGLAANIQSLADAAAMGVLHLDDDSPAVLKRACDKNVYALSRALGIKAKEVKARLGDPADQLSVSEAESLIDRKISEQLRGFIKAFKDKQAEAWHPLDAERQALKDQHRAARAALSAFHAKRSKAELKDRLVLRTGLGGLWDRFTGRAAEIRKANELAAWQSAKRDQSERDTLVFDQMIERRKLQSKVHALRQSQQLERSVMARMIGDAYRTKSLGIVRPTDEARAMARKRTAERFNIGADPPDHAEADKVRPPKGPDLSR